MTSIHNEALSATLAAAMHAGCLEGVQKRVGDQGERLYEGRVGEAMGGWTQRHSTMGLGRAQESYKACDDAGGEGSKTIAEGGREVGGGGHMGCPSAYLVG